jgi:hypothetical protein
MIEGYMPPLVVVFTIDEDKNVILQRAEYAEDSGM